MHAVRVWFLTSKGKVFVVACVECVFSRLVRVEFQGEQGVLAPRDVGVHVDLVQVFRKVGEPLSAHGPEVYLEPENFGVIEVAGEEIVL